MFTSDIEIFKKKYIRTSFIYLIISIFCALFGAVYELFSHGVYSYFMIYSFAFPLLMGTLPYFLLYFSKKIIRISSIVNHLHIASVATFTIGSILNGVLDIYGTTNKLIYTYWLAGEILLLICLLVFLLSYTKQ